MLEEVRAVLGVDQGDAISAEAGPGEASTEGAGRARGRDDLVELRTRTLVRVAAGGLRIVQELRQGGEGLLLGCLVVLQVTEDLLELLRTVGLGINVLETLANRDLRVLRIVQQEGLPGGCEVQACDEVLVVFKVKKLCRLTQGQCLRELFHVGQHLARRLLPVELLDVKSHRDLDCVRKLKVLVLLLEETLVEEGAASAALGDAGVVEVVVRRRLLGVLEGVVNRNEHVLRQVDEVEPQGVEVDNGALPAHGTE